MLGLSAPALSACSHRALTSQQCFRRSSRVIGNWGMAVRCWGTKRRHEDIGDYQPSGLSLQIWDKGIASRTEARTLKRFISQTLSDKHKHTQQKFKQRYIFAVCLPTCLPVCTNLYGKNIAITNVFRELFSATVKCAIALPIWNKQRQL